MATKVTPELEEISNLESAMERSYQEFNESETGSSASVKSSYSSVPDSSVRSSRAKAEWEKQLDMDFLEIEDSILRSAAELEEAYNSLKSRKKKQLENDKLREKNSVSNVNVDGSVEVKKSILGSMSEGGEDLEGTVFKKCRIPLENFNNRKNEASVSGGNEGKIANKHIAEIEELNDKCLDEIVEQELRNETGSLKNGEGNEAFVQNENRALKLANEKEFYASQERILRKIQNLEEQRKMSGSLKSDDQKKAAATQNVDAVTNKHADEKENVSVQLENKIINKHKERDIVERYDRVLRALNTKINLNATQKRDSSELPNRTHIPENRTGAADDGEEEKIINKDEKDEKDILERQDTILRKALKLEEELEKRQKSEVTKLMEPISSCRIDTVDDRQAETCIPLMDDEAVSIDLNEERETSREEESQKNANGKTKWKYFRSLSSAKKSSVDVYLSGMRKSMRDRRNAASKTSDCFKTVASSM